MDNTDWSDESKLRKSLARLSRPQLAKVCKSKKVSIYGNKKQQIHRLLKFAKKRSEVSHKSHKSHKLQQYNKKKSKKHNKTKSKASVKTKKKIKTNKTIISQDNQPFIENAVSPSQLIDIQDSNTPILHSDAYVNSVEDYVNIENDDDTNETKTNFASKFIGLEEGDDVDVNPVMNGHKNWRCGEIDEIVKDGNRILKIKVLYEQDDDYPDVWIEL
eukprot:461693_1